MTSTTRTETSDNNTEFEKFKNLTQRLLKVDKEELRDALQHDRENHAEKKDDNKG